MYLFYLVLWVIFNGNLTLEIFLIGLVVAAAVFALVYFTTRYVSLSSILGAAALGISFACWHFDRPWAVAFCLATCLLAIVMHRENIVRLLDKTERKTDFFKKEKQK